MAPDMKIRVPPTLKRQIEKAASANKRTLNGEILARLEASFAAQSKAAADALLRLSPALDDPLEARVADLEARLAKLEKQEG